MIRLVRIPSRALKYPSGWPTAKRPRGRPVQAGSSRSTKATTYRQDGGSVRKDGWRRSRPPAGYFQCPAREGYGCSFAVHSMPVSGNALPESQGQQADEKSTAPSRAPADSARTEPPTAGGLYPPIRAGGGVPFGYGRPPE